MTCICGVVDDNSVYLAADSAISYGETVTLCGLPKLWSAGGAVIAAAGDMRAINLARLIEAPELSGDVIQWAMSFFVDPLRALLLQRGAEASTAQFLIGVSGNLLYVGDDFGLVVAGDGYTAAGCGADFALGSLHSTRGKAPTRRLKAAVRASAAHCLSVRAPVVTMST